MTRFLSAVLAATAVMAFSASQAAAAATPGAPVSASAGRKAKSVKPRIKLLGYGQRAITRGKLKVRITARPKARVRVTATSSTFDDGSSTLAKPKTVRFGRKRSKLVTLSVTAAARAAAAGCQARTVLVKGRSGRKTGKASGQMERQSADCKLAAVDVSRARDCDFIAKPKEGMCMLPFPDDYYTVDDASTPTGKRIHFTAGGMPANDEGTSIDPTTYSDSDGFSQGAGMAVKIPGIETAEAVTANNLVPINDIGRYADADQRVVVIDTDTGRRWPIWANIDSNASTPADSVLEIKPARNFDAKGHYIVALRNLTDVDGNPLQAPDAFRYYRDQIPSGQAEINSRRSHFEGLFKSLRKAGIKRSDLYLAWDFTVASDENNYARALSMRDRAFAELGDTNLGDETIQGDAPSFVVDSKTNFTIGQNARVARRVIGHYTVPCYLEPNCGPGGTMNLNADRLPTRNGNYQANFDCIIPRVAFDGPEKMRPMMFGHGLFGRADGVTGSVNPQLAQQEKMVVCATDEIGMSGDDPAKIIPALFDLSEFKVLPDRLAQGLLNELFLARLMYHPGGFGTSPAFQNGDGTAAGESVIRTDHVYYMGASQGGIMGGALTALSPDFTQASLLVGGMNYSMLLPRSIDFDLYAGFLYPAYPNQMSRPILFGLMQMLWDRSEPNGYAHRMTDNPLPDTPRHNVTLQIALGDHQVSNFAAEVEARTVGMATHAPVVDAARWPDMDILWDVPRIADSEYPYHGSNIIYLDGGPMRPKPGDPSKTIGTTPPPFENIANRNGEDPHGAPRGADQAVLMTSTFLQPNGYINNVCGASACYGGDWTGLP